MKNITFFIVIKSIIHGTDLLFFQSSFLMLEFDLSLYFLRNLYTFCDKEKSVLQCIVQVNCNHVSYNIILTVMFLKTKI